MGCANSNRGHGGASRADMKCSGQWREWHTGIHDRDYLPVLSCLHNAPFNYP